MHGIMLLIALLAAESADAPLSEDARIARYTTERASLFKVVELRPWKKRKVEVIWVEIAGEKISHWAFARRYAQVTGAMLDPAMAALYDPPNRRIKALEGGGYAFGGIAIGVGVSTFGEGLGESSECAVFRCSQLQRDAIRREIIGGGALALSGLGLAVAALLYRNLTEVPEKPHVPYFERDELLAMVKHYNSALRQRYGIDDAVEAELLAAERALPRYEKAEEAAPE